MDNRVTWHPVVLPSMGIFYGEKCPGGAVEITPWTTAQEEMFVRYGGTKPMELIGRLIESNVRLPAGMKHEDMLLTDRYFLLFQLRSLSLLPYYSFTHTCPKCSLEHQVTVDLTTLKVKVPDAGAPQEPFEVKLPKCGRSVHVRFLRVSDEQAIEAYEQTVLRSINDPGSPATRFKIARQIEMIDGHTPKFDEKMSFVKDLHFLDLTLIRMTLDKNETGMLLNITTVCPRAGCGQVDKWVLPFDNGFFRLTDADLERAGQPSTRSGEGDNVFGQ